MPLTTMQVMSILLLLFGFAAVTYGADMFVDGASGIARKLSISPLIIGLTIVALGTSAPEIAVNMTAAWDGQGNLAVGNVLGSNILNVLLVLGLCASIASLSVQARLIRLDVPVMIFAAGAVFAFSLDRTISRSEAIILCVILVAYTLVQLVLAKKDRTQNKEAEDDDEEGDSTPVWKLIGFLVAGSVLLVFGSKALVSGATDIARALGISELIIGLTIVALGTSLPELATSIAATLKGERDLAVGNVVGSNIYNLLAVLGLTGLVIKDGIPVPKDALTFDFPVMMATSVACLPIFFVQYRLSRWEGVFFVVYYLAYLGYLILRSLGHAWANTFGAAMLQFVVPLTLITMVILWVRHARTKKHEPA